MSLIVMLAGIVLVAAGIAWMPARAVAERTPRLAWTIVPVIATCEQVRAAATHGAARLVLVFSAQAFVVGWLAGNALRSSGTQRRALGALLVGSVLNGIPMVFDGGMPVSAAGLRGIGDTGDDVTIGHLGKHVLAHHALVDRLLGDVMPVTKVGAVVSIGDLVLLAGALALLAAVVSGRRQRASVLLVH